MPKFMWLPDNGTIELEAGKELRRIQNANRQSDANNTSAAVAANAAVAVAAADLKLSCGLGYVSGRCL